MSDDEVVEQDAIDQDEHRQQCAADRDVVELLRQRVQQADELLNTVSAYSVAFEATTGGLDGQLVDALEAALDALSCAAGKAYSVDDTAVQAVARALLGVDETTDDTEWCVFVGDRPSTGRRMVGLGRSSAEELRHRINTRDFLPGSTLDVNFGDTTGMAKVAHRTTRRTPWQVVDTEGGE